MLTVRDQTTHYLTEEKDDRNDDQNPTKVM